METLTARAVRDACRNSSPHMIAGNLPAVQATAALILVSTLASSQLRCAAYRLLGVCVKLLLTTSVLILVSGGLAVVKPLQTTTPLFNAVSARDLSRVTELLEYAHVRLNINVGKTTMLGMLSLNTPLHTAASTGHTEMVSALLKAGADPNAPTTLGLGMLFSDTPLHTAADNGHMEMVSALLKAGADPNAPFTLGLGMLFSHTPLNTAANNGHMEMVSALLKAGADPNAPLTLGLGMLSSETPLSTAARNGHTEVMSALLKAGADPNAPLTLGLGMLISDTPLSMAADNGHTEVVSALLKAGAKPIGYGQDS